MPSGSLTAKATEASSIGREGDTSDGVYDFGTFMKDGPVTWEIHTLPRAQSGDDGEPVTTSPGSKGWRASPTTRAATPQGVRIPKQVRLEVGQRQGEPEPRPKGAWKSEGRIGAKKSGKGRQPTRRSKDSPC